MSNLMRAAWQSKKSDFSCSRAADKSSHFGHSYRRKQLEFSFFIFYFFFQLNINWKFLSLLPFLSNDKFSTSAAATTSSISFAAQDHFSLSNQSHIETSFSSSKSLIKLLRSYFAIIHCYFPIYSPNLAQNLSLSHFDENQSTATDLITIIKSRT